MGAWIETETSLPFRPVRHVAPREGAWIETLKLIQVVLTEESLPAWGAWIEALSAFVVQGHHRSLCALFNQDNDSIDAMFSSLYPY